MTQENQTSQGVYTSTDIASILGVQDSTIRKYCLILEDEHYKFLKNPRGHRAFLDSDIVSLKKFIEFKDHGDMTLKESARAVVAWKSGSHITERDTEILRYVERYDDLLEEFTAFRKEQERFNQELMDQVQHYMDIKMNERDQKLLLPPAETKDVKKATTLRDETAKRWWQFWR